MASSIVRYTSTTSLISTASQLPRESNVFVQALNKHRDVLETACDKILEKCYSSVKPGEFNIFLIFQQFQSYKIIPCLCFCPSVHIFSMRSIINFIWLLPFCGIKIFQCQMYAT